MDAKDKCENESQKQSERTISNHAIPLRTVPRYDRSPRIVERGRRRRPAPTRRRARKVRRF